MASSSGRNNGSGDRRAARPGGSLVGAAMPIGAGFGVALGLVLDNLALGIAIGLAMGTAIGAALEQNRRGAGAKTRAADRRWVWVVIGGGLGLLLGILALVALLGLR